jgi:hypothetical protein
MRITFIFSMVSLVLVTVVWLRKRQHHTALAATKPPAQVTAAPVRPPVAVLEAPQRFTLQSGERSIVVGKAMMKLANVWHFDPKKISATFPFPLQAIEVNFGLANAAKDSLGSATELSPSESFLFHDTVFTLQTLSLPPQKGRHSDAFTAGDGTVELTTRTAPRTTKACPLGEWIQLSMAEICAIENGPKFSVWRLGANRARLARETELGELRHWLNFDLGVAGDDQWILRGRNFDATHGSLEVMVTKRSTAEANTSPPPAFNQAFWIALEEQRAMPGGFQIATHGTEITRYGTLVVHFDATKLDQDANAYASLRLYKYPRNGDDEEASNTDKGFTLCGRNYTIVALGFRKSNHKTEVQLKVTRKELPKFSYGQPLTMQSGQASFMHFQDQYIEGPQGEVLGCLGESHRHGRDAKGEPATWGWIDFEFFTSSKAHRLHLPTEQFRPGYVWNAGEHKIEVVKPHTAAGIELRVSSPDAAISR